MVIVIIKSVAPYNPVSEDKPENKVIEKKDDDEETYQPKEDFV